MQNKHYREALRIRRIVEERDPNTSAEALALAFITFARERTGLSISQIRALLNESIVDYKDEKVKELGFYD